MSSPTTRERSLLSVIQQTTPASTVKKHRLYFRLNRIGRVNASGIIESLPCDLGKHKTKLETYTAVQIRFSQNKYMDAIPVRSCLEHIPVGSWVEGRDKSTKEPDPQTDRLVEILRRKHRIGN